MSDGAWRPTKRLLKNAELVVLPSVFQKHISGYITHVCKAYIFFNWSHIYKERNID